MGKQKVKQKKDSLQKFLNYVLGRRPDEFGLVPDEEGFIPIKELLQALSEEEGWRHVRRSDIDDLLREPDQSGLELRDKDIRVAPGQSALQFGPHPEVFPPPRLFHAARRKAYPVILEKGLNPGARPFVTLVADPELALRIGKRRDSQPVLLTVETEKAVRRGIVFRRPQEHIFLVEELSPDLFTGPPPPKETPVPEKKKKVEKPVEEPHPGSFFLDPDRFPDQPGRRDKSEKKKRSDVPDWKRAARKERRKRERE